MSIRKALPLDGAFDDARTIAERRPSLVEFPTPLVTLSEAALRQNVDTMARWAREHGVVLAPHGKTTMSRELWQRQLDAGAWGITVATPWQLSIALDWGIPRIMLANALVQPSALRFVAARAKEHEILVWADSRRAIEIMDEVLADVETDGRIGVLIELGATGGRTGARSRDEALGMAKAVADSPRLRLAGVSGYEGSLAHTGDQAALAVVRGYLEELAALHADIEAAGLYRPDEPVMVTAGGSAYFDVVAEVLAPLTAPANERRGEVRAVIRPGAYISHDDGFYRVITPLGRAEGETFRSAIHGWATVVSHPEPDLVLVDAGKRDFPFDEGLPEPQAIRRYGSAATEPFEGASVTAMNDQHTFVRVPQGHDIQVGDVVRFGLSHPCTTFDKWSALPLVDDAEVASPQIVGLVETVFG